VLRRLTYVSTSWSPLPKPEVAVADPGSTTETVGLTNATV